MKNVGVRQAVLVAITSLLACGDNTGGPAGEMAAKASYVDRNGNGAMDIYEDASKPRSERGADLLSRLSLEQ